MFLYVNKRVFGVIISILDFFQWNNNTAKATNAKPNATSNGSTIGTRTRYNTNNDNNVSTNS
jgi:hypothetical protein